MNDNIANLFDIAGKVAVVTGGSGGIGRMIARGLLTAGARVFIVARNTVNCEQTVRELSCVGDICAIPGDLSSVKGIRNVAASFAVMQKKLDILVSNAGLMEVAPIDD